MIIHHFVARQSEILYKVCPAGKSDPVPARTMTLLGMDGKKCNCIPLDEAVLLARDLSERMEYEIRRLKIRENGP